jgi:DNA gyrase inhibitor GyrI
VSRATEAKRFRLAVEAGSCITQALAGADAPTVIVRRVAEALDAWECDLYEYHPESRTLTAAALWARELTDADLAWVGTTISGLRNIPIGTFNTGLIYNQLINADSLLIGIPQDDPSITSPEKQRFDICVQIPEFRNPSGHIGCQTISAGMFGVSRHYGSFDNLAEAYMHIYDSLVTTGKYNLRTQTPFEVYSYTRVKGEIRFHFTDVYLPVEKNPSHQKN